MAVCARHCIGCLVAVSYPCSARCGESCLFVCFSYDMWTLCVRRHGQRFRTCLPRFRISRCVHVIVYFIFFHSIEACFNNSGIHMIVVTIHFRAVLLRYHTINIIFLTSFEILNRPCPFLRFWCDEFYCSFIFLHSVEILNRPCPFLSFLVRRILFLIILIFHSVGLLNRPCPFFRFWCL